MGVHWENLGRGAIGMTFLILVCYMLSNNRSTINWKLVGMGLLAQVMFAMGVLNTQIGNQPVFWVFAGIMLVFLIAGEIRRNGIPHKANPAAFFWFAAVIFAFVFFFLADTQLFPTRGFSFLIGAVFLAILFRFLRRSSVSLLKWSFYINMVLLTIAVYTKWCPPDIFRQILQGVSTSFVSLINIGHQGTEFMFGRLADPSDSWAYVFAIQVLPNIIFFAALSSILYYLGILQKLVYVFAYLLNKLNISGAESLSTAANIFLGQTEAPIMIRPYLEGMNRSEILCIMVGGMANTAGSVLAAYVGFLGGNDVDQQNYFALHMLSQSIMSAPAAIVCSKILFPQPKGAEISKRLEIPREKLGDNFLDAISMGTTDGLKLAVNVGAMLIVFTAVMGLVNALMGWIGGVSGLNNTIASYTNGQYQELSLQLILGYLFAPIAWMIGVARTDIVTIGQLLGEKTILNEFVAYVSLGRMKADNLITDPKSLLIATYALCGFANFASIGIQIGGISQLAPNQRRNLTELGLKSLIGGTIACLMCGCIAGALF